MGTAAAAALVVSSAACAAGADAEEPPQPTVLESLAAAEEGEDELPSENGAEQSDETPQEDPEPTPVPASSEGPAQNWPAPEPPEEIFTPTEEGAEALLQYWFDARHYARITGDTKPLEEVSHEDCELCRAELELVNEVFANSGWYVGDEDSILNSYMRMESEALATGLFSLKESEFESYVDGNAYGSTQSDGSYAHEVYAVFDDNIWTVSQILYLSEYDNYR